MQLICGGVGLLALSGLAGEWSNFSPQHVTMVSVAGLLYLAVLGSAIANTAYLWLLDRMPAPFVATYTFVNPVIALFLGWWMLKEQITLAGAIGAALVVASVVPLQLSNIRANSRKGSPS
jgi:drug/metabolite transporter (DMT)-like permease